MSSENATSGLRLSGRYTSARNVVISIVVPSRWQPTVPNRLPCSHTWSAHGRTRRSTSSGPGVGGDVDVDVLVVAHDPVEERVAHAAADEVALVARVDEQARELLHRRRRVEQRLEASGDLHHRRPLSSVPGSSARTDFRTPRARDRRVPGAGGRSGTVGRWQSGAPTRSAAPRPRRAWRSTRSPASCGSTRSRPTAHATSGARGAGALCTRHADRLVPPRGWAVQDRRGPEPRLWSDRPVADAVPAPPRRHGVRGAGRAASDRRRRAASVRRIAAAVHRSTWSAGTAPVRTHATTSRPCSPRRRARCCRRAFNPARQFGAGRTDVPVAVALRSTHAAGGQAD